jgi:hypothetical protein
LLFILDGFCKTIDNEGSAITLSPLVNDNMAWTWLGVSFWGELEVEVAGVLKLEDAEADPSVGLAEVKIERALNSENVHADGSKILSGVEVAEVIELEEAEADSAKELIEAFPEIMLPPVVHSLSMFFALLEAAFSEMPSGAEFIVSGTLDSCSYARRGSGDGIRTGILTARGATTEVCGARRGIAHVLVSGG